MLAPSSFPITDSEAIVNAKLAYALSSNGYEVVVFSRRSNLNTDLYPKSKEEQDILSSNRLSVETFYTQNGRNFRSLYQHLLAFGLTGLFIRGNNWSYFAIKRALQLHKKKPFDILITRGFLTETAGIYLARKLRIPWIANWNDPYPLERFPAPYGKGPQARLSRMQEKALRLTQTYAAIHTFPCVRLRDYMLGYFSLIDSNATLVVPHMAHSNFVPEKENTFSGKIRLLHAGFVGHPRNPHNFLEALSRVFRIEHWQRKIECVFVGKQLKDFADEIRRFHLEDVVKQIAPKSYFEVLGMIASSDVSLIIEAICEEGIYLPTKFVDALQSLTPVFCVSPESGTLHDFVTRYNVGYHANNASVDDIACKLESLMEKWESHELLKIDPNEVSYFFERDIVNQYSQLFETLSK